MDHSFAVSIADGIGDLPQDVESLLRCQLVAVGGEVVVEANGSGVGVAKQQRRAKFMLLVLQHGEDVGMVERLDDLKFTGCRSFAPLPFFFGVCLGHRVLANSTMDILERSMFRQSVLVAGTIGQQLAQHVIADTT